MTSILIVEDNPQLLTLYKVLLERAGFSILGMAKNGEEAVNQFKFFPRKPDIVLMDHHLPRKNGLEAAREILHMKKGTKIIFASADPTIQEAALSLGAAGFLKKPFDRRTLIRLIQTVLNIPHGSLSQIKKR